MNPIFYSKFLKRVSKTAKALSLLVRNPWKLNLILNENEEWKKYLNKKYKFYNLPVIPITFFIRQPITIKRVAFLEGGSWPTDLALLKQIAADIKNCKFFEIGTWRGESVSNVAAVSATCYTLNLPEKELQKLSNEKNYIPSHHFFSRNLKNVIQLRGNSLKFDFESLKIKFDLIFIDGDHHYESIVNDTQKVIKHLSHDQTIIVWHDYSYNPESVRYETLAAIMDACPDSMHKHLFHVGNTNCAILYKIPVETYKFEKFAIPDHIFSVKLTIEPAIHL